MSLGVDAVEPRFAFAHGDADPVGDVPGLLVEVGVGLELLVGTARGPLPLEPVGGVVREFYELFEVTVPMASGLTRASLRSRAASGCVGRSLSRYCSIGLVSMRLAGISQWDSGW